MKQGKLIDSGPPRDIVGRTALQTVFGVAFATYELDRELMILPTAGADRTAKPLA